MQRLVEPEWLDELPADEPRAIRSRADLRRLNWFMNHTGILARALRETDRPQRVIDLGCGDGAFTFRLAQAAGWRDCEVLLVDRNPQLSPLLRRKFAERRWTVRILEHDVLDGLDTIPAADIIVTNLFLHHFDDAVLSQMLPQIAGKCRMFAACEPRRSSLSLLGSRLVGLLGCNNVTRHDAPASVRAGFRDQEISKLWCVAAGGKLEERPAGLFSHLFVAQRT